MDISITNVPDDTESINITIIKGKGSSDKEVMVTCNKPQTIQTPAQVPVTTGTGVAPQVAPASTTSTTTGVFDGIY